MKCRDYQKQAIAKSLASLGDTGRALVQLPTGTGKSLVLLEVAREWQINGRAVYVVSPSRQTVEQLRALAWTLGMVGSIEYEGKKSSRYAPLTFSTYNSAWLRFQVRPPASTLLVLDECHHVNYQAPVNQQVLAHFEHALGLSASPWSDGCDEFFGAQPYVYPLSRARAEGRVCEFEIKPWADPTSGRFNLIYTNDKLKMSHLTKTLRPSDYAIYSKADAQSVITRFRSGAIHNLIVDRMVTEGFDLKQIKKVWICKETTTVIAAYQMAGRALRPDGDKQASIYVLSNQVDRILRKAIAKAG